MVVAVDRRKSAAASTARHALRRSRAMEYDGDFGKQKDKAMRRVMCSTVAMVTGAVMILLPVVTTRAQDNHSELDALVKQYLAAHPDVVGDIIKDYVGKHPD